MVDVDVVDFVNTSLINATQELLVDPDFEDLARKSDGFVHIGVGVCYRVGGCSISSHHRCQMHRAVAL